MVLHRIFGHTSQAFDGSEYISTRRSQHADLEDLLCRNGIVTPAKSRNRQTTDLVIGSKIPGLDECRRNWEKVARGIVGLVVFVEAVYLNEGEQVCCGSAPVSFESVPCRESAK